MNNSAVPPNYYQRGVKSKDAHKLPFSTEYFDIVVCTEVLEHIRNPDQVLKEMKRVLKKDGSVILEIDTNNLLFKIIWSAWIRFRGKVWKGTHLHSFSVQELEKLFGKTGFRVSKKKVFNLSMAVTFRLKKN